MGRDMASAAASRAGRIWSDLSDRMLSSRDRLVSSLAFQRAVSRLPFIRRIAQNRARDVFDLVSGFVYSQVLLSCVELGLLQQLLRRTMTLEELSNTGNMPLESMERLVAAAVSLKILSWRSEGRVGLGMRGAAIAGNAGLIEMIAHHRIFYRDLTDPVALLRGERATELARYWGYAGGQGRTLEGADIAAYSELMSASQTLVADAVLDAYPFAQHHVMLDAGGGDGTFICRVGARHPRLEFLHFDLPAVSARAAEKFAAAGLERSAHSFAGSFLEDELPRGADLVTLVRVLHDHDIEGVKKILGRVRSAMSPGGTLLIAEPLAGTRGAESMGDAYFGFYLMAMGNGQARTKDEMEVLLTAAGFSRVREIASAIPLQTRILTAKVD